MKKSIKSLLALVVLVATFAMANLALATAFEPINGSVVLPNRQAVVYTRNPGNLGGPVEDYVAVVTMNIGDPVSMVYNVYVTATALTYPIGVTRSATLGDKTMIGVVAFPNRSSTSSTPVTTASPGTVVDVQTRGVALARMGPASVTVGDILVQSATAGQLTAAAAVTQGPFTQVSRTAAVAMAIETKLTPTSEMLIRVRIIAP